MKTAKIFLITALFCFIAGNAFAERYRVVTTKQLFEKTKFLDHQMVVVKGEVIGDIMPRGKFVWLNVQDGDDVIGVWAPREAVGDITHAGDYQHQGDIVKVKGQFWRADPRLGGEFCIRAHAVEVIKEGHATPHAVSRQKIQFVLYLAALALILLILRGIIRRRAG